MLWANQRRRMGLYMAYTPRSCDHREYIAESGVYIWQFRWLHFVCRPDCKVFKKGNCCRQCANVFVPMLLWLLSHSQSNMVLNGHICKPFHQKWVSVCLLWFCYRDLWVYSCCIVSWISDVINSIASSGRHTCIGDNVCACYVLHGLNKLKPIKLTSMGMINH